MRSIYDNIMTILIEGISVSIVRNSELRIYRNTQSLAIQIYYNHVYSFRRHMA